VLAREQHQDGNWHLHLVVQLKRSGTLRYLTIPHKELELQGKRGNYQPTRNINACFKYCAKDDDFVYWGVHPKDINANQVQHKRNLWSEFANGNIKLIELIDERPELIQHYSRLKVNLSAFQTDKLSRSTRPTVIFIQGEPGVGKTTMALKLSPDHYIVQLASQGIWWMDGYTGQQQLIFDNISSRTHPPMDWTLKVCDAGMAIAQTKGGHVNITSPVIIFTSTQSPEEIWGVDTADIQFFRRITTYLLGVWGANRQPVWGTRDISQMSTPIPQQTLDMISSMTDITQLCNYTKTLPVQKSMTDFITNKKQKQTTSNETSNQYANDAIFYERFQ